MYILGKYLLIAAYAVTLCVTMRYYLRLLQQNSWDAKAYLGVLFRENLRWLPLLFMLIPSAALFLGYRTLGMGLMLLYLLGIQLLFGRGRKESLQGMEPQGNGLPGKDLPGVPKGDDKKLHGLFALWCGLWGVLVLGCFGIPKTQIRVMHLICGVAFLAQPFVAPLLAKLGAPAEHRIGTHYIRGTGDILRRHRGLQIILIGGSSDQQEMGRILQALLSGRYRSMMTEGVLRTALEAARTVRGIQDPGLEILICPIEAADSKELSEMVKTLHPEIAVQTSVDFVSLSEETDPAGEHGIRMINGDDEALLQCVKKEKVLTFGLQKECDIRGAVTLVGSAGTRFTVSGTGKKEVEYQTTLLGIRQLRLLVGSIGIARILGMSEEEIRYRMASVLPLPHHMQLVPVANAMLLDDSANADPDLAEDALRTLEQFEGEKILITSGFTCLGEIQKTANYRVGELAAEVCDRVILVGTEVPYGLRSGILDAGYPPERLLEVKDKEEARALVGSWPLVKDRILLVEQMSAEALRPRDEVHPSDK